MRFVAFEALERRNMLALVIDVGHILVEPNAPGQDFQIPITSTDSRDPQISGLNLRAQISRAGPVFESVDFSTDLWNTYPHGEGGGPVASDQHLAMGSVGFDQGFEAIGNGIAVKLSVDTTGIVAGSFELRLAGTRVGSTEVLQADGTQLPAVVVNGTLQVRSMWQNPDNASDVDGDGFVSPYDVLLVINLLNKQGSGPFPMPSSDNAPPPYYDTDGDGQLSAGDGLVVINCLNGAVCRRLPFPIAAKPIPSGEIANPDGVGVGNPMPGDEETPEEPLEEADPLAPVPDPDEKIDEEIVEMEEEADPLSSLAELGPVTENEKVDEEPVDIVLESTPIDELVDLGLDYELFAKS